MQDHRESSDPEPGLGHLPDIVLDQARQALYSSKLGKLETWRVPDIAETIGPRDLEPFDRYDTARRNVVSKVRAKLAEYSDEQIAILSETTLGKMSGLQNEWRAFMADGVRELQTYVPSWYCAGFGHPDHVASFEYWSKMAKLSLMELLHLSIGIEPGCFSASDIAMLRNHHPSSHWKPQRFLVQRLDLLRREFGMDEQKTTVRIASFVPWAEKVRFEVHPEFMTRLKLYHMAAPATPAAVSATKAAAPAKPDKPDKREIDKIALLLTAIAITEYGFRPEQKRSPIPKEIADIAASLGLSITPETVLKYLRHGASFLPGGWQAKE